MWCGEQEETACAYSQPLLAALQPRACNPCHMHERTPTSPHIGHPPTVVVCCSITSCSITSRIPIGWTAVTNPINQRDCVTFVAIALHATAEHRLQLRGVYCPRRDYPALPPVPGPSTRCDTRVTAHNAGPGAEGHILLAKRRRHGATGSLPMCLRAHTHACCTQLSRGLRCGDGEPPGAHGSVVCLCRWWCVCACV